MFIVAADRLLELVQEIIAVSELIPRVDVLRIRLQDQRKCLQSFCIPVLLLEGHSLVKESIFVGRVDGKG